MLSPPTTQLPETLVTTEASLMAPPCMDEPMATSTMAATTTTTTTTMATLDASCVDANCSTTVLTSQPGATIVSPLLLSLTGVTGQVWALCYLHGSARRHNARTVFYVFLCTLIWTDLVGKMLTTPPAVISYTAGGWMGGKAMCDYHGFVMVLISMLTHFTVSAMAVERYLGICHGYFYSRNVTTSRCRYLLLGIWVSCTAFGLLPLFDVGQLFLQYPGTWCFANFHLCGPETPIRHRVYTNALGVVNAANLLVIVSCNVVVVGTLLKMRLSRQMPSRLCQPHRSRKQSEHEMQMVIVLVVITIVFVMSWAPLDTILLTTQMLPPHRTYKDHMQELIAIRLVSINQIVDPWVYIICRVAFRSRAWKCCRHALLGRGWSRRRSSSFNMASLLHGRKSSRAHSPQAKEQPAIINNAILESGDAAVRTRPQPIKSTRVPSLQKSYYSDSGTGSYSGVEVPLLESSPEGHSLAPDVVRGSKGSALEQSLAKSLSVAIPIPLFTSEQYRLKEFGKEGADDPHHHHHHHHHQYANGGRGTPTHRFPRPVHRVVSTASVQDPIGSPFLLIHGCAEAGVLRSNSWSCHGALSAGPQYRTQSTQTLSGGNPQRPRQEEPPQESPSPDAGADDREPPSATPFLLPEDPPDAGDPPEGPGGEGEGGPQGLR